MKDVPSDEVMQTLAEELGITIQISGKTILLEGDSSVAQAMPSDQMPPPNRRLDDDGVYYAYVSDQDAPEEQDNILQFDYEAVYIVPAELRYNRDEREKACTRMTPVGKRREPVWSLDGSKLAYLDLSGGREQSRIAIIDVQTGTETYTEGVHPISWWGGLSWDGSGNILAYRSVEGNLCTYDLQTREETAHISTGAENLAISPDGERICFMVREGEDLNDTDGWRFKVLSRVTGELRVVGETDDRFGILGPFYWGHDSSWLLFQGFYLTPENTRTDRRWYRYNLPTGDIQPYPGNFRDIYDQAVRYWIRP